MRSEAAHEVKVVHAIPGRVRLKYHRLRKSPQMSRTIHGKLSAIKGVKRAEANPTTSSVVVHYDPGQKSIELFLEIAAVFGLAAADVDAMELLPSLLTDTFDSEGSGREWDQLWKTIENSIPNLSHQDMNLGLIVPAALCFLGARSLMVSDVWQMPRWYEYFWFAFGVYFTLNKPESPADAAT
jgi:cation transport ATPase